VALRWLRVLWLALSWLLVACAGTGGNPAAVLRDAASAYKVDTDAIAAKVKQELTAKEKARKATQPATKAAKKAA